MNEESLITETIMSEDHLDAMFTILDELHSEVITDSKKDIWTCEWDNVHGDIISFK